MKWIALAVVMLGLSAYGQQRRPSPIDPVTPYDQVVERRLRLLEEGAATQPRLNLRVETNTGQYASFYALESLTLASSSGVLRATTSPTARPLNAHPIVWFESPFNTETDPIFGTWLATNPLDDFLTEYTETDPEFNAWLDGDPLDDFLTEYTETDPGFSAWLADPPFVYVSHTGNVDIAGGLALSGAGTFDTNLTFYSVAATDPAGTAYAAGASGVYRRTGGLWELLGSEPVAGATYASGNPQAICASVDGARLFVVARTSESHGVVAEYAGGAWTVLREGVNRRTRAACSADGEVLALVPPSGAPELVYRESSAGPWVTNSSVGITSVAVSPEGGVIHTLDGLYGSLYRVELPGGGASAVAGAPAVGVYGVAASTGSEVLLVVATNGIHVREAGSWSAVGSLETLFGLPEGAIVTGLSGGSVGMSADGQTRYVGARYGYTLPGLGAGYEGSSVVRWVGEDRWARLKLLGGVVGGAVAPSAAPGGEFAVYPEAGQVWVLDDRASGGIYATGPVIVGSRFNVLDELLETWAYRQRGHLEAGGLVPMTGNLNMGGRSITNASAVRAESLTVASATTNFIMLEDFALGGYDPQDQPDGQYAWEDGEYVHSTPDFWKLVPDTIYPGEDPIPVWRLWKYIGGEMLWGQGAGLCYASEFPAGPWRENGSPFAPLATGTGLLGETGAVIEGGVVMADSFVGDGSQLTGIPTAEAFDAKLGALEAELAAGRRLYYCVQRSFTNEASQVYGILSTTPQTGSYTVAIGPITNTVYQQYQPGRGRITEEGLGISSIPAGKFFQTLYFVNPGSSGRNVTMQIVASIVDADGENPVELATSSEATLETKGDIIQRLEVDFVVPESVVVDPTDRLLLDYYFRRSGLTTGTAPTITRHAGGTAAGVLSFDVPSSVVMLTDGSNSTVPFATNIVFAGHTVTYDAATRTFTIAVE